MLLFALLFHAGIAITLCMTLGPIGFVIYLLLLIVLGNCSNA